MQKFSESQRRQIYEEEKHKREEHRKRRSNRISVGCLVFIAFFLIGIALIPICGGRDSNGFVQSEEQIAPSLRNAIVRPTVASVIATKNPSDTNLTSFGDGAWLVGLEILPGTYRTIGPSSDCYWARLVELSDVKTFIQRSESATESGVKSSGAANEVIIVWILDGDVAFETWGCGKWRRIAEP